MLVIRKQQLGVFQDPVLRQFENNMLLHIQRYFPIDSGLLGEAQLRAAIRQAGTIALSLSIDEQADVCQYINISLSLGTDFTRDPLHPWAAAIFANGVGEPGTFQRLYDAAISYIETVSGEEGEYAVRAYLRARALSFDDAADPEADHADGTLAVLRRLWPQKYRRLSPDDRARFLALADKRARADGFTTPGSRQVYTILMFMVGSFFGRDATIPWARAALSDTDSAPDERARALLDAGQRFVDSFVAMLPSQRQA